MYVVILEQACCVREESVDAKDGIKVDILRSELAYKHLLEGFFVLEEPAVGRRYIVFDKLITTLIIDQPFQIGFCAIRVGRLVTRGRVYRGTCLVLNC